MAVFQCLTKTRLNFTPNFLDQNNPKSKYISAEMSLSISEILKPFKKNLSPVISGLTTQGKYTPARFLKSFKKVLVKLLISSSSF